MRIWEYATLVVAFGRVDGVMPASAGMPFIVLFVVLSEESSPSVKRLRYSVLPTDAMPTGALPAGTVADTVLFPAAITEIVPSLKFST